MYRMLRDAPLDEYQLAARRLREVVKNKAYRAYPMGGEAGAYLRWKRGRISDATYRSYEGCLDKLAKHFPDLEISDFEPPVGVERMEEFLDQHWGENAPGTFNTNHAILSDFFKWAVLKGKLHGDPMTPIPRHKKRDVHRETFSIDHIRRIVAEGPHPDQLRRDRILLQLILKYGLRKGAIQKIQFRHFDANRKELTVFTKGEKVRNLRIVDAWLWDELAKLQFDLSAEPHHYLLSSRKRWKGFVGYDERGVAKTVWREKRYPEKPLSVGRVHEWWYGCLQRAGIVPEGVFRGEKMHKGRHTAGQRLLDSTGNIKAVQKLLMHESPTTTMEHYVDWDNDQLEASMLEVQD